MAFDFNALGKNDKVALVTGVLASILTFFPWYYGAKVEAGSISQSESVNAWHELGFLGSLLLVAATVIVIVRVVGGSLPAGAPWNLITAGLAGLGTILLLIYGFFIVGPDTGGYEGSGIDISQGVGWSGWLLFVAAIVFTAFAFLGFKDSGEQVPDFNKGNDAPPAPPTA